jgi:hypothetical protein
MIEIMFESSGLLLGAYISILVLVSGLLPSLRWRAIAYSLPLPISAVILEQQTDVGVEQFVGVGLLAAFLWCAALAVRFVGHIPSVGVGVGMYVLGAAVLSRTPDPWLWGVALLMAVAWVYSVRWWGLRPWRDEEAPTHQLGWVRAVIVIVSTYGALLLGGLIGGFLVTFPFAGTIVALDNRYSLKPFARNFTLFGIPALITYMAIVMASQQAGLPALACVILGFFGWVIAMVILRSFGGRRMHSHFMQIAQIVGQDPGGRGIGPLQSDTQRAESLFDSCELVRRASRIALVTGFPIPTAEPMRAETDGPPGTATLASVLIEMGKSVTVVTDAVCLPVVQAVGERAGLAGRTVAPSRNGLQAGELAETELVIFVERPGPANDGVCYSMSGVPLPSMVPLHTLQNDRPTIAIGDGGNEVGMGVIQELVAAHVKLGDRIACVVPSDALLVAGTSNWGALGLAAALGLGGSVSTRAKVRDLLSPAFQRPLVEACILGGAIDGVTGLPRPTVDGLETDIYEGAITDLAHVLGRS